MLWSRHSVVSHWVRTEAAEARAKGMLVPACLDDATIPLACRHIQAASLAGWTGKHSHTGFNAPREGISAVLARRAETEPEAAAPAREPAGREAPAAAAIPAAHVMFRRLVRSFLRRLPLRTPLRLPELPPLPAWLRSRPRCASWSLRPRFWEYPCNLESWPAGT